MENLIPCCNNHDKCYETCKPDKPDQNQKYCDTNFGQCLHSQCRKKFTDSKSSSFVACDASAKAMFTLVRKFGDNFYTGCNKDKKKNIVSGIIKDAKSSISSLFKDVKSSFGKHG